MVSVVEVRAGEPVPVPPYEKIEVN